MPGTLEATWGVRRTPGKLPDGALGRRWLGVEYVKGCSQPSGCQFLKESARVYDGSAGVH